MSENNNLQLQQEINQNMTIASSQPFAMSNEEQAFNIQQQLRGNFNRSNRRRTGQERIEQQSNTREWVNKSNVTGSMVHIEAVEQSRLAKDWVHNVSQDVLSATQRNNRASSESIDTIRENIKNSQESLKKRSCESLTIEQASLQKSIGSTSVKKNDKAIDSGRCRETENSSLNRNSANNLTISGTGEGKISNINRENSIEKSGQCCNIRTNENNKVTDDDITSENNKNKENVKPTLDNASPINKSNVTSTESTDSLNESTFDLSRSYRSLSMKDPHSAAIDLSNNCRQFYFNHMKAAEAIKQSVRSAKHTRAIEKMEGKPSSRIDNAMDRLRSEMADLMDQDLSLMSQLLKLNDKIEEVKTHVAYRQQRESFTSQSSCYLSGSEMSDSEFEDNDDSRFDLSKSAKDFKLPAIRLPQEAEPQKEVVLRRLEPADSRIIVYKKKKSRNGKRRTKKSISRPETDEDSMEESGESEEDDNDSLSGTESTLSHSSSTINGSDQSGDNADQTSDAPDSGIQSPKAPEEPPKPKKGGISQNRRFLNFHKKNGNFSKSILTGLNVLTMQGHNVPLDKYYVPQGLVYLKQEKSENVFCQFTK
ncbi:extracellular matrix-binding protein ebh-like [Ruditapes philippinarum]|uniref:extracellular matrix-binding protein ebh-like n=1 Tax=Ruditapes philippinarum TaxID=129788 RepID=UPI00295C29E8|nr:extracellular matrix-binding protein ebh-like [Ruditapes philippinarum]